MNISFLFGLVNKQANYKRERAAPVRSETEPAT